MDLEKITDPSFLKELDIRQLNQLADDIRIFQKREDIFRVT